MNPLTADDLLSLEDYDRHRRELVRELVDYKKRCRRVQLGPRCSVVFENRRTVLHQVQEMLRIERIFEADKARAELDVYNELLPGAGELRATVFLEFADQEEARRLLPSLANIEAGGLPMHVGEAHVVPGVFDAGRSDEGRTSAIQYARWRFSEAQRRALADPTAVVRLRFDHPGYRAETRLANSVRASLAEDLDDT